MNTPWKHVLIPASLASLLLVAPASAQKYRRTNLLSDGSVPTPNSDPNFVNPWGITASPTGPFWISDNGSGTAAIVRGDGVEALPDIEIPRGRGGAPTGAVFNPTAGFVVGSGAQSGPSHFLFATEDGTILGWSPDADPGAAIVGVNQSTQGAVYKGLALGSVGDHPFLYATNFASGRVEVFDERFSPVGSFTDDGVPEHYAPFGIARIDGLLVVSFAEREVGGTDDVPGHGHGILDAFAFDGTLLRRLVTHGDLDSPWGIVRAPSHFGKFSRALLVGNFGDGRIHAYDLHSGSLRGTIENEAGDPMVIDGLWGLAFGNGAMSGDRRTLYFTAGPNHEGDGVFGSIERVQSH